MFSLIIAPIGIAGLGCAFFLWRLSIDIQKEKQFRAELAGLTPPNESQSARNLVMAARLISPASLR
jgi:hypothetical protein